ncbi:MAG: DsbA family protein [Candidatus Uhrbacteria bacterium]
MELESRGIRQPWHRRSWGIAIIVYLIIMVVLGVVLLVVRRGANAEQPVAGYDAALLFSESDPAIGATDAVLTIVEFADFECPYCQEVFPTIREVAMQYGEQVRYIFRDMPVESLHADARAAAEAAQCAHAQGRFWEYHDRLFMNAPAFDATALARYANEAGLDVSAFTTCFDTHEFADAVQGDLDDGRALGVQGTPTWFLIPNGDATRAVRVEGIIPRESFRSLIENVL